MVGRVARSGRRASAPRPRAGRPRARPRGGTARGRRAASAVGAAIAVESGAAGERSRDASRSRSMTSARSRLCASASAMRNSAGRSMRGSSRRTHSSTAVAPGIRERVGRALGAVAVAVDAHFGEEPRPLEAPDRVVQRAVRDRDEAVVAPLAHQPHHLVGMHVAFAEQREDHQAQRREAVDGVLPCALLRCRLVHMDYTSGRAYREGHAYR